MAKARKVLQLVLMIVHKSQLSQLFTNHKYQLLAPIFLSERECCQCGSVANSIVANYQLVIGTGYWQHWQHSIIVLEDKRQRTEDEGWISRSTLQPDPLSFVLCRLSCLSLWHSESRRRITPCTPQAQNRAFGAHFCHDDSPMYETRAQFEQSGWAARQNSRWMWMSPCTRSPFPE